MHLLSDWLLTATHSLESLTSCAYQYAGMPYTFPGASVEGKLSRAIDATQNIEEFVVLPDPDKTYCKLSFHVDQGIMTAVPGMVPARYVEPSQTAVGKAQPWREIGRAHV